MANYTAEVIWSRSGQNFIDNRYSRKHLIRFDGGIEVTGSSSPHVVPLPYSALDAIDPEETFVASLSSCHMLWSLSMALKHGFVVDEYHDTAEGVMAKNAEGKLMISLIRRPAVQFSSERRPSKADLEDLHHLAHEARDRPAQTFSCAISRLCSVNWVPKSASAKAAVWRWFCSRGACLS